MTIKKALSGLLKISLHILISVVISVLFKPLAVVSAYVLVPSVVVVQPIVTGFLVVAVVVLVFVLRTP